MSHSIHKRDVGKLKHR